MKLNLDKILKQKRDRVVDLTDTGRRNKGGAFSLIRRKDLVTDPITGTEQWVDVPPEVSDDDFHSGEWLVRRRPSKNNKVASTEGDDIPFIVVTSAENNHKDNGLSAKYQAPIPQDPEESYEEYLESTGATVINSTTYFPASGITTTKRSQTHDEIAKERGYLTR
jgi:hypothetical protein